MQRRFVGRKGRHTKPGGWKEGIDLDRSISVNIMVMVYFVFLNVFFCEIMPTVLRDMNENESV